MQFLLVRNDDNNSFLYKYALSTGYYNNTNNSVYFQRYQSYLGQKIHSEEKPKYQDSTPDTKESTKDFDGTPGKFKSIVVKKLW